MQSIISWEEKLKVEKSYYEKKGHLVPMHKDWFQGVPIGKWVDGQRQNKIKGRLTTEQIEELESIGMVWSFPDARWNAMMEALERYHKLNGNCDVPKGTVVCFGEKEYDLYGWLKHKRVYRANLSEEQRNRLEAVGVVWDPHEHAWEKGFKRALVFREAYGHLNVRETYRDETGFGLGRWIRAQRDDYAKGKSKLSEDRIRSLESIGMVWQGWDKSKTSWAEQAIFHYVKKVCPDAANGDRSRFGFEIDVWVPSLNLAIEYDGPFHASAEVQARDIEKNAECRKSGVRLIRIREAGLPAIDSEGDGVRYLILSDSYTLEHALVDIEKTLREDFGINASLDVDLARDRYEIDKLIARLNDGRWHKRYEELRDYYLRFGSSSVPKGKIVNGKDLGQWVYEQRKLYRKNRLESYKVELLNNLNFEWNPLEDQWFVTYEKLKAFVGSTGRLPLRKDDEFLYQWMYDQRKRVALSDERISLLRELNVLGCESKKEQRFQMMLSKLREFKLQNGHCIVPQDEGTGEQFQLGNWATQMRLRLKKGDLPKHWAESLLEVGLPLSNKDAKFQRNCAIAAKYREENGHLRVPQKYVDEASGIRLGAWINAQRLLYRSNALSSDRIAALEALDMIWNPSNRNYAA